MPYPDGVRGALARALTAFRWLTLAYAVVAVGHAVGRAGRPALGIAVYAAMGAWTLGLTVLAARRPAPAPVVVLDVAVCAAAVLLTSAVGPVGHRSLAGVWAAGGVLAAAVAFGTLGGLAGGAVLSAATFVERGAVDRSSLGQAALFLLAGGVVGYLVRTAAQAETALAAALRARAADAERARIAGRVHDGALQVLALIAREAPRGLPAREVAALAAEQEVALRDLLRSGGPGAAASGEQADLAELLVGLGRTPGGPPVTVATPGAPVPLPAGPAREVVAAVCAALDNVARHAGPGASAWLLLEDSGDEVTVTVRDDGVGLAPGRLAGAEAEGRLGLALSVRGRIEELAGRVVVTGAPGAGTEVELHVPRR